MNTTYQISQHPLISHEPHLGDVHLQMQLLLNAVLCCHATPHIFLTNLFCDEISAVIWGIIYCATA